MFVPSLTTLALALVLSAEPAAEPMFRVGPDGPELRLGMSRAEIHALVGEPDRTELGGAEYLAGGFAVLYSRKTDLVNGFLAGQSSTPGPLSEAFKGTIAGVEMGSTRADVERELGAPSEVRTEGAAEILDFAQKGITFQLAAGRVHHVTVTRARSVPKPCN